MTMNRTLKQALLLGTVVLLTVIALQQTGYDNAARFLTWGTIILGAGAAVARNYGRRANGDHPA
jgi:hypothetical protein